MESETQSLVSEINEHEPGSKKTYTEDGLVNEENRLLQTMVYKRRWYVMIVFCLSAMSQGGSWGIFGPISAAAEDAFGWKDSDIALLTAWGPIAYLISTFPFAWLIESKGIRVACLTASFLVLAGAGVRCITTTPPYVTWTSNIGQLLNGLAGPITFGAPPVLSALWFPAGQRTTATALNTVLNSIGNAMTFILGPYLVPERKSCIHVFQNKSTINDSITVNCTSNETIIGDERHDIIWIMYYVISLRSVLLVEETRVPEEHDRPVANLWFCGFVFLLICVYFPAKPKLPPSVSASTQRLDFRAGIKDLMKNVKFGLICLTFGVSQGVFSCWQGVLDVILKPHGINQTEAGWLGFYSLVAGCFASLVFARFADVFSKHMRLFLLFLYVCASGSFVWFIFLVEDIIPSSTVSLYVSIIIGTMFLQSTIPLFFEMACEAAYPVPEGTTNLVLTLSSNVGGLVFLLIQMIPNIGTTWATWCMLGGIVSCIPVLAFIKEQYNRLDIDEKLQ